MDASDFIALFLVILGFAYILRWYLNRHFVGSRTGDSTCSICGGDLTIEKESIGKEISKRFYFQILPFPRKHRVKEMWICQICNNKVERTVSFG